MDTAKLRAWWSHRQGLDGRLQSSNPAKVLKESGWARSVAGVGPYLTLFSRAGISREAADTSVANTEICELPSARSCTYVLPASDFALGLAASTINGDPEMKLALKLGVTVEEIDKLCKAVVRALEKEPLSPDEIRLATGDASRSLGEEGKKKGMTTTLPLALGRLQGEGEIRRVPIGGRLDQQRYKYALWRPNPCAEFHLTREEVQTELARRFFQWIGPATVADFQTFAAVGVGAAKAAVEPLGLKPIDDAGQLMLLPEDIGRFAEFKPSTEPQYSLVSSLDSIALLRRSIDHLVDPTDAARQVLAEKKAASLGGLTYFPAHAILDRGRLVGLWEFEVSSSSIVWFPFIERNAELSKSVATTEAFVRDQLGDARSFSLDSPKSREPAIHALRDMK